MKHTPKRITVLRLAAEADVDPRSARKALDEGPRAVRGRAGERIADAMAALNLVPSTESNPPPQAA